MALHSILAREVEGHAQSGTPFTVSLLRVSGMMSAALGADNEEARNFILQRVAVALTDHAGAGDHLFRYTDSDFLILEVDSSLERCLERQRGLWRRLDDLLRQHATQHVAASVRIVIAAADGHPDYRRLLRRVEFAIASVGEDTPVTAV
ncbi:MAG: diguanylate cyclase [Proteobacteria bacterium]|nr:diguanylate cyclase [Pseudomonadota bacterium]